jgi:hypothetical protein
MIDLRLFKTLLAVASRYDLLYVDRVCFQTFQLLRRAVSRSVRNSSFSCVLNVAYKLSLYFCWVELSVLPYDRLTLKLKVLRNFLH